MDTLAIESLRSGTFITVKSLTLGTYTTACFLYLLWMQLYKLLA